VLHYLGGPRRTPDSVYLLTTPKCTTKKVIKAPNVVHMEMRKKQVINRLDFTEREVRKTPITAIEEQTVHRLT
jgi:hypothetical protein